jgi:hypothetical protein
VNVATKHTLNQTPLNALQINLKNILIDSRFIESEKLVKADLFLDNSPYQPSPLISLVQNSQFNSSQFHFFQSSDF